MLNYSIIIALIFSLSATNIQETNSLSVSFEGFKNNKGKVFVALYNTEASFMKKELTGMTAIINNGKATVVFEGLKSGNYAISSFHDKNDNGKLDTNFIGIPKEPYAFSNNAKGSFGPPKFRSAKFAIKSENKIIKIKF